MMRLVDMSREIDLLTFLFLRDLRRRNINEHQLI